MLEQMHSLRQTNLHLQSELQIQTDHSTVLTSRLRTVKEKYNYVKLQRNKAYGRVRELTSEG